MPVERIGTEEDFPVTLAEAKRFARVDADDDDALIETLIASATEFAESMTGRRFIAADYRLSLRAFPALNSGLLFLPVSPVLSITTLKYRDRDGDAHFLQANQDFLADLSAQPATVEPVKSWPSTGDYPDAVAIEFVAGYPGLGSPLDPAAAVPSRAKVAIMALVAHWFENREATDLANRNLSRSEVPLHVSRLLRSLRVGGI